MGLGHPRATSQCCQAHAASPELLIFPNLTLHSGRLLWLLSLPLLHSVFFFLSWRTLIREHAAMPPLKQSTPFSWSHRLPPTYYLNSLYPFTAKLLDRLVIAVCKFPVPIAVMLLFSTLQLTTVSRYWSARGQSSEYYLTYRIWQSWSLPSSNISFNFQDGAAPRSPMPHGHLFAQAPYQWSHHWGSKPRRPPACPWPSSWLCPLTSSVLLSNLMV